MYITYKPHDSNKKVSTFAFKVKKGMYIALDKNGNKLKQVRKGVDRMEFIITGPSVVEKPAGMSLHYARMEILK